MIPTWKYCDHPCKKMIANARAGVRRGNLPPYELRKAKALIKKVKNHVTSPGIEPGLEA